jgi:hypothetical protein
MQLVIVWGILLVRVCTAAAQGNEQQDSVRDVLARLKDVQESRDFPALEKLVGDVFSKMRKPNEHFDLVREFCAVLNSVNFKNDKQGEILQRLAVKTVVEFDDQLPVTLRVQLVRHIRLDYPYHREKLRGAEWVTIRRDRVRLWLKAFMHLEKAINREFDFRDLPRANLSPPGNKYRSGVSPESINEPDIREQYVKLLKANTEKSKRYALQRELHDLEKAYLRELELNVVRAYSFEPISVEEIRENFGEFGVPEELTARVIKQLEARLLAKIQLDAKLAKLPPMARILDITPTTGLGADPRLRAKLTVNFKVPRVEEVLNALRKATGVTLNRAEDIQNDYYVAGSYGFVQIPAFSIMETLASSKYVQGRWQRDGDGYLLVRNGKPVATPSPPPIWPRKAVNDPEGPPPAAASGFTFWLILVSSIAIPILLFAVVWRHRRRVGAVSGPGK